MQKIINFVLELEKLKGITRKVRPLGLERYENSAEHSWQISLLANALVPYATKPVNIARVISMLLVHDIGEIDTGDTLVYEENGWVERKAAERRAVERIFGILSDGQGLELMSLWQEFELGETPEAQFANAVDRAMPVIINLANQGQSWRENRISHAQVVKRIRPQIEAGCPALWAWLEARLDDADHQNWFGA